MFFRLSIDGSDTADWPLSRKFGCNAECVIRLAVKAKALGLIPYGISFHVGSQQRKIDLWDSALEETKTIFDILAHEHQIHLKMLNLGGGLPAQYVQETEALLVIPSKLMLHLRYLNLISLNRLFWNLGALWSEMQAF